MSKLSKNKKQKFCLKPEGEMTIFTAEQTKPMFMEALQSRQDIEVDLSEVTEMDTAGLQLLIMSRCETNRNGLNMQLVNHTDAVIDVMDTCNMAGFFGDQQIITSTELQQGEN